LKLITNMTPLPFGSGVMRFLLRVTGLAGSVAHPIVGSGGVKNHFLAAWLLIFYNIFTFL
jgi:hypothetical protein